MMRRFAAVASVVAVAGGLLLSSPAHAACPGDSDPNVVYMTGMEHGRSSTESGAPFSYGSNSGGTGGPDTTTVHAGKYSLRLAPNGGPVYRERVVAWQPVLVERFYIRLGSLPLDDSRELASIYTIKSTAKNSGGNAPRYALHFGYESSNSKFTLELNTQTPGTRVESTSPAVAGTWHLVEIRYDVTTTTNTADWRIDGVDQTQVTLAGGPATLINEVVWGSTFNDTYDANYDEFMISQTSGDYPLGGGRILGLKPNDSSGPHNPNDATLNNYFKDVEAGVASNVGPTTWQGLTDDPMDQHGRHIAQIANSSTAYVQIGFEDTVEPCIRAVQGWMSYDPLNAKRNTNNGKTSVFDGTREAVIYSGSMSYPSTNIWTKTAVVPSPADELNGWTTARVNGLVVRVGYSTDTNPRPWWDALMLEYEADPDPPLPLP